MVVGPVIFTAATEELLEQVDSSGDKVVARTTAARRGDALVTRREDLPRFAGEEIVVVPSPLLPHPLSDRREDYTMGVLISLNGIKVMNLRHLATLVRDSRHDFFVFEFGGRYVRPLVLPRAACIAATEEILSKSRIPKRASADILSILKE